MHPGLAERTAGDAPSDENGPAEVAEQRVAMALSRGEEDPSARDFAYQVLLIVVSAVVSALVWKVLD